jgi:hypothetical protein
VRGAPEEVLPADCLCEEHRKKCCLQTVCARSTGRSVACGLSVIGAPDSPA